MDQSIGGGESQILPEIAERIKTEGCPDCGLKGGKHTPECYYFSAISPETAAAKQPLVSDLSAEVLAKAEAPKMEGEEKLAAKEPEKEMTAEEEKKFREELLKRAKPFEEAIATSIPTIEIPKPVEIPAAGAAEKEGVFEELFARPEPVEAPEVKKIEKPVVEKPVQQVSGKPAPEIAAEPKKEDIEKKPKEIIPPAAEIKAVPEIKEVKKELKKEEIAANAVIAAVEMARDFISAGAAKITEEQAEKAALAALKDWEKITTGMTAAERYETFSAAERAVLEKIPEGKILEKIKGKIFVEVEER